MLLLDPTLFEIVHNIDQDTVSSAAAAGCPHCGGTLDRAYYPRKPRGLPGSADALFDRRPSFCCRQDGCRRRLTPILLAFLGRSVYISVTVILGAAMRQGATPFRLRELHRLIGVSPRTVRRWLVWWREVLPSSGQWRQRSGGLVPAVDESKLPSSLLERLEPLGANHFRNFVICLRMVMG